MEENIDCDAYVPSKITEPDGNCWGCARFWNDSCPYGKMATDNDRESLE